MDARQLSHELREADNADLRRRRQIIGLSLVGAAMGGIVTLYQTGIIKRLPDPPVPIFDSSRVDASDYGYKRMQTPDGVMMLFTYALTIWLAAAGGKDRVRQMPALPVALALKTLADALLNIEFAREEWGENKAFCAYCQTASLCSLASVIVAYPEAAEALRNLSGG